MHTDPENLDVITKEIIGAAIEVHRALGPGLLESVYRVCLVIELRLRSLKVEEARKVFIEYKGHHPSAWLVLDLIVEDRIVVELKAVERLYPLHSSQVITYLKLSGLPTALLINFNTTTMKSGLRRLYRPDLYRSKSDQLTDGRLVNSFGISSPDAAISSDPIEPPGTQATSTT